LAHGATGSGKTTLTKELYKRLQELGVDVAFLSTSIVKERIGLLGIMRGDPRRDEVYQELNRRIMRAFRRHQVVVVDGTYGKRSWREPLYRHCHEQGVHLTLMYCVCEDEAEVRRRTSARRKQWIAAKHEQRKRDRDGEGSTFRHYLSEKRHFDEVLADNFPKRMAIKIQVIDTFNETFNSYLLNDTCDVIDKALFLL